jgi:hypothetical protein
VLAAPMVRLQTKSRRRHHRYEPNNRPSLRDGFNGVLRALPGDRAFLPPSPREMIFREAWRQRRGARTTRLLRTRPQRSSIAKAASIASRWPTFVTIAKRPSARPQDGRKGARDLPDAASALACGKLTRRAICAWGACADCPSGEIGRAR